MRFEEAYEGFQIGIIMIAVYSPYLQIPKDQHRYHYINGKGDHRQQAQIA